MVVQEVGLSLRGMPGTTSSLPLSNVTNHSDSQYSSAPHIKPDPILQIVDYAQIVAASLPYETTVTKAGDHLALRCAEIVVHMADGSDLWVVASCNQQRGEVVQAIASKYEACLSRVGG
jgi:hypothetical protein